MRLALINVAAFVAFCGAGSRALAQFGVTPLERDLFPPVGYVVPFLSSDLLGGTMLEQFGLEGEVRSVALYMIEFPDARPPGDRGVPLIVQFTHDGMIERMTYGDDEYVQLDVGFRTSHTKNGESEWKRMIGHDVRPGHDDDDRVHTVLYAFEFDNAGDPVSFRLEGTVAREYEIVRRAGDQGSSGEVVYAVDGQTAMTVELDESDRVTLIKGAWFRDGLGGVAVLHGDERIKLRVQSSGEILLDITLDDRGDPIDLQGKLAAPTIGTNFQSEHSRRAYERDEHGNWTSMLVEYELEEGWKQMTLFQREIEYWDD